MDDPAGVGFFLLALLLGFWFVLWVYILLPAGMARNRNRSAFIWVPIGIFGSPFLAVPLLLALDYRPIGGAGR